MTSDPIEVIRLGVAARDAQKRYFRTRDRSDLVASKQAEKAFDEAAAAVLRETTEPARMHIANRGDGTEARGNYLGRALLKARPNAENGRPLRRLIL